MTKIERVAILGSTGYVGLELVRILSNHPNTEIVFLGTENNPNTSIQEFDNSISSKNIPIIYKSVDWWASLHQPASIKFTASRTAIPSSGRSLLQLSMMPFISPAISPIAFVKAVIRS